MISRYHPPDTIAVISSLLLIRYAAASNNGPTDTCCTPCKCSPVSRWPGPQGPGKNNVTRLLAPALRTMAAQNWPRQTPAKTRPLQLHPSGAGEFSWGWGREPSELGPPHSSDLFVGRHCFCSSCFSLIVKFSFALNSLPLFSLRLYFFVKDKKVSDKEDQALSWITPTPNELLYLCVSRVFSWGQAPKSLTQWSMYGRGERPIKQLSSLLVN